MSRRTMLSTLTACGCLAMVGCSSEAPSTQSAAPSTQSAAPSTQSAAPSTQSAAPSTTFRYGKGPIEPDAFLHDLELANSRHAVRTYHTKQTFGDWASIDGLVDHSDPNEIHARLTVEARPDMERPAEVSDVVLIGADKSFVKFADSQAWSTNTGLSQLDDFLPLETLVAMLQGQWEGAVGTLKVTSVQGEGSDASGHKFTVSVIEMLEDSSTSRPEESLLELRLDDDMQVTLLKGSSKGSGLEWAYSQFNEPVSQIGIPSPTSNSTNR